MLIKTSFASLAFVALFTAQRGEPQKDVDPVAHAGRMYSERCINCHQPPDTRFATDRAWLQQVYDTA